MENVPRALVKSMESVCLCPGHTCPRSTVLRGHLSLSGAAVGLGGHSHALLTGEVTGTKGTPFCQPVTLSTPLHGRQAESALWYVLGASLRLTPWLHSQKLEILALQKVWPKYKLSSVQSLSRLQLFVTPWTAACQASLSITNSQSMLKLMSIELVMPSNHLILCRPLLLLSISPSISVFSNESALRIRCPKY